MVPRARNRISKWAIDLIFLRGNRTTGGSDTDNTRGDYSAQCEK